MQARLVRSDEDEFGSAIWIESADTIVGRDPSADVHLDSPDVSWNHAAIRALGDRHTLEDLGSTNGTSVNGIAVQDSVLLEDGDRIRFGEEVCFVYELSALEETSDEPLPARRRVPVLSATAAVLAALVALAYWALAPEPRDPVLDQATELARDGLVAARHGEATVAKTKFQSAIGTLYQHGQLDHVSRAEVPETAMKLLSARMGEDVDLWSIFNETLRSTRPKPRVANAMTECRLDALPVSDVEACMRERIEWVMIALRQDVTAIPPDFHREVGATMKREHEFLMSSLARGRDLVPMLRRELENARMPPLLHYVALIESGYRNTATSQSEAVGLWQFMPETGRQYGLVGPGRDERRDPLKSTRAAARYLRDLAFEFGGDALLLALAGYNRGENGVRRALKRLDDPFSDRSYWRLVERRLIPEETAQYVPRFLAAAVAGEAGLPDPEVLEAAGY